MTVSDVGAKYLRTRDWVSDVGIKLMRIGSVMWVFSLRGLSEWCWCWVCEKNWMSDISVESVRFDPSRIWYERCVSQPKRTDAVPRRRPPRRPSGKASTWRAEDPGSNPACDGIFSGSSHTSDSKIGTSVATLPGAWRYRVSTGTGRPGVSILWLGEVESLICSFYLSVAARIIVWADPSLRYTSMLLGR